MDFKHTPVLLAECIENLSIKPGGIYVDGTIGGGGHAQGICGRLSEKGVLIGIDRDWDALKAAEKRLEGFSCKRYFIKSNFSEIRRILKGLGITGIDGAVLDLGVSSFQIDNAERGFSYMRKAPLDMRMDREDSFTAYDVVNGYSKKELARVISLYGEERWASRIASFIASARETKPVENTSELVEIIKNAIPAGARRKGPHPAKRTFQAVRIEVNGELGELEKAMDGFFDVLNGGGRLCVISFHSLEDRIVKEAIARRAKPSPYPGGFPADVAGRTAGCGGAPDIKKITKKPILPSGEESENNPRSRSAKLRVCEKEQR